MALRALDRALWLHTGVAGCVVLASLVVYKELDDRAARHAGDEAQALAGETAARLSGRFDAVLSTLRTVASSPAANRDAQIAPLRANGTVTTVTVTGPVTTLSMADAARDLGEPRLSVPAAGTPVTAVAPLYRGFPLGTMQRRDALDGFVVATLDMNRILVESDPSPPRQTARLVDNRVVIAGGRLLPGRPVASRTLEVGGRSYVLEVSGHRPNGPSPLLPLVALVLALTGWSAGARTVRARRRAEHAARVRADELATLADLGSLLQRSLDLEVILPGLTVRLQEQLDLEGCGVLRANRPGRLVHAFTLGEAPAIPPGGTLDVLTPPQHVAAGETAYFPLQRAGRITGALWIRPRAALDGATVRSVHATAEMVAAALSNADAYEKERETVRRLEELDHIKNRFIGTVSHEMRTSASAIAGFAGLLDSRWQLLEDSERRDLVMRITHNGHSLMSIVEDFLDFSRLERRSPASDPPPACLSDLVASSLDNLAPLIGDRPLVTRIPAGVGALVDQPALERTLANLISNVVKYSPAGSTVTVTVEAGEDESRLAVEDEGPGIPADERDHVFEAFYRGRNEAVPGTRGAGIGLAVVKEIADRLRGHVSVEVSPSGGARIVVAFRAAWIPTPPPALIPGGSNAN